MRKSPLPIADSVAARSRDTDDVTIDRLADLLTELAGIAQNRGYAFLAYLIEMAAIEARSEAVREADGNR